MLWGSKTFHPLLSWIQPLPARLAAREAVKSRGIEPRQLSLLSKHTHAPASESRRLPIPPRISQRGNFPETHRATAGQPPRGPTSSHQAAHSTSMLITPARVEQSHFRATDTKPEPKPSPGEKSSSRVPRTALTIATPGLRAEAKYLREDGRAVRALQLMLLKIHRKRAALQPARRTTTILYFQTPR